MTNKEYRRYTLTEIAKALRDLSSIEHLHPNVANELSCYANDIEELIPLYEELKDKAWKYDQLCD